MPHIDRMIVIVGVLPLIITLSFLATSVYCLARNPNSPQSMFGVVAIPVLGYSAYFLMNMIRGAWPTYLPYYMTGAMIPVVIVQYIVFCLTQPDEPPGFSMQEGEDDKNVPYAKADMNYPPSERRW